jgi:hypothetical protein
MEITKNKITRADEYIDFVRKFTTLLDEQMSSHEKENLDDNGLLNLATSLPALISLVNTVGYLRGQDGMFLDIRPRTDSQQELYALEDSFENRLKKLIDTVMKSNQKDFYLDKLNTYFIKARS